MASQKQRLRSDAISEMCAHLKNNVDWEEVIALVCHEDRFDALFAGKSDDEANDYAHGLLRSAETLLGFNR